MRKQPAISSVACRREHSRLLLPDGVPGNVAFDYPAPGGEPCVMRLRDISRCGLSFVLSRELPGLEVGRTVDRITIRVGDREIRGEVLVMHLTPDASPGSLCGVLFYPAGDEDVLAVRATLADLASPGGNPSG